MSRNGSGPYRSMGWTFGLIFVLGVLFLPESASASEKWSFAVIADIHDAHASYRNVLDEMKTPRAAREVRAECIDFLLVLGDLSPVSVNYALFQKTFEGPRPFFLPARGNHENKGDLQVIGERVLPAAEAVVGSMLNRFSPAGFSYWFDWKGARIILLDQYADFKKSGTSPHALRWLEQALDSAHSADHIFVGFHEPFFPWETEEDPFWRVLIRHRADIRAVLFGHTHVYFRTRYPDPFGGIHVINVGNGGRNAHSDKRQTILYVNVEGKSAHAATVQAPDGRKDFRLAESFSLNKP